jgi:hypothetical protein
MDPVTVGAVIGLVPKIKALFGGGEPEFKQSETGSYTVKFVVQDQTGAQHTYSTWNYKVAKSIKGYLDKGYKLVTITSPYMDNTLAAELNALYGYESPSIAQRDDAINQANGGFPSTGNNTLDFIGSTAASIIQWDDKKTGYLGIVDPSLQKQKYMYVALALGGGFILWLAMGKR